MVRVVNLQNDTLANVYSKYCLDATKEEFGEFDIVSDYPFPYIHVNSDKLDDLLRIDVDARIMEVKSKSHLKRAISLAEKMESCLMARGNEFRVRKMYWD